MQQTLLWLIPRGCRCVRCQGLTTRGHFKYQPNREEMSYYLLHSPEGAEHERGRGLMFSESNKRCTGKKLALQTKLSMLCSSRWKRAFENGPGMFQREAVFGGTRKKKKRMPRRTLTRFWCSFKLKNQIPSDWEANVYPILKTETNKRNPILRCKCQM